MNMKSALQWILVLDVFVSPCIFLLSYSGQVVAYSNGSGGISIDCGVEQGYTDPETKFEYVADDASFVESGETHNVSSNYTFNKVEQIGKQLNTLRSFPNGYRNCYTLKPQQGRGNYYLVRAFFAYGNYDGKNTIPEFDVHLGVNFWTTISLDGAYYFSRIEVIHFLSTDSIDVCLLNTGEGVPFISLLELWHLPDSEYQASPTLLPLRLRTRPDLGMPQQYDFIRYPDDNYGRSWFNKPINNTVRMEAKTAILSDVPENTFKLPNGVLSTAVQSPTVSSSLDIDFEFYEDVEYYVYLHFYDFEVQSEKNLQRKIEITFPDSIRVPLTLEYQKPQTQVHSFKPTNYSYGISITSPGSDLPAMLNAYEIYSVIPQKYPPTDEGDVDALPKIKKIYKIMRTDWQGDPCMPSSYTWEGLSCNSDKTPRVTSLNLGSSNLTGEINASFSKIRKLVSLDLSNNKLTGEIPEFLAELPSLTLLNLTANNLVGSIPEALKENSGLTLSLDGNPGLCQTGRCKTIRKRSIIPLLASIAASVAVLVMIIICISVMLWRRKKKKQSVMITSSKKDGQLKYKNRSFCYSEILSITNDFKTVIGEGGFGKVYLGTLQDGTQVAVKLLSRSSRQGFKEFQSEAELLMIVHHRNLVSLVGYCDDGDMKALVYEYMTKGNLQHQLSDKSPYFLKWNERLQIALDAACGLDYLHNGCKPPIIHRDLKTSNILLNEDMQAKIADFGLSRAFASDIDTHVSTHPAGTFGYLDPEFHSSGSMNKKSDVYSFGIILLELMTGQPAIRGTPENTFHILHWVTPKLECGDIQSIVDPRLKGKFSTTTAWKFLEIAISCIPPAAIQRPDISHIVADLKECLALQMSLESAESNGKISSTTSDISYFHLESDMVPYAR